jgi:hypothetical protein
MTNTVSTMTKAQLIAALADLDVAAPRKANLETLRALYLASYTGGADHIAIADMDCPHCGVHLSNGLLHVDDTEANSERTYREAGDQDWLAGEFMCMGCGGHFGAIPELAAPAKRSKPTGTGLKIEKDREERNGVKRPSAGGKCRAIWDYLDGYVASVGVQPTSQTVKSAAEELGWNPSNASIEFYQWRKFNGIKGRAPKPAPVEAPAA